jgi:hypothetical protein
VREPARIEAVELVDLPSGHRSQLTRPEQRGATLVDAIG